MILRHPTTSCAPSESITSPGRPGGGTAEAALLTSLANWFGFLTVPIEGLMLTPFVTQKFSLFPADLDKNDLVTRGGLLHSGKVARVIDCAVGFTGPS